MEKITMTVLEVAKLLNVSTRTIYLMANEKQIPHFKARGRVLFNREIIENWTRDESLNSIKREPKAVEA